MAIRPTGKFRNEAVRAGLTSGLPRNQMARDFRIGFSTLSHWIQQAGRNSEKPAAQSDLEREIAELRKENRMLREGAEDQERPRWGVSPTNDVPKKAPSSLRIEPGGYRAFRSRPLSQSQRKDMVVLAHIGEQFRLSLGSRPKFLRQHGFQVSMSGTRSGTGNCYDNAAVEAFIKTIKAELLRHRS